MLLGWEIIGQISGADVQCVAYLLWRGIGIALRQKQPGRFLNDLIFCGVYTSSRHTFHLLFFIKIRTVASFGLLLICTNPILAQIQNNASSIFHFLKKF